MTAKKPKAAHARQRSYKERMREKGFAQTQVWVPEADLDRVLKYAEKLRKAHERARRASNG